MPLMDGMTATREIRALEGDGPHTPIVALTANAMTGQLERCLQAGMNGYLTKPLEISRLQEILERYGLNADPLGQSQAGKPTPAPAAVDSARWQELTADDREFAAELAATFIASGQQMIDEIAGALASFDRSCLVRAAHKLKGASANVHAEQLLGLAYELETQSASLDQERLKDLVQRLQREFARTSEFMQQHIPSASQSAAAHGS
jgi:CheY-like chemotaxis protein